ncbi:MAG: MlaD family protein [Steroidobacteraceae bacterium]
MTDSHSDGQQQPPGGARRVEARVRHGWWPGWIWAIPIAALIVVGWLGARYLLRGGKSITITFENAHDLKQDNSNVVYRGTDVGRVTQVQLNTAGTAVTVTASIDQSATKFLRSGTRFWLRGASPSLSNLASLASLLSGPTIVMDPGPGSPATHFIGLEHDPVSPSRASHPLLYEVSFSGEVGALESGDPVKLRGFTVGEVRDIGFSYDSRTGELSTPSTIAIYPSLLHIRGAADPDSSAALSAAVETLIRKGMRARLDRDPPLVGSYRVSLDMVLGAPAVTPAVVDGLPQIPVAPGGGLNSLVTRLNKVPIEQIAQNVLDITHHVDALVSSPQLKDAIVQLNAALKQIRRMTTKAGPQITALTVTLHKAADDLDRTANSANRLVSGTATEGGIETTLREIKDAARSIRSLADYLDRHPEALIRGRP